MEIWQDYSEPVSCCIENRHQHADRRATAEELQKWSEEGSVIYVSNYKQVAYIAHSAC